MVNHKTLYKIILVVGLLLTMVLTLSLTEYTIAYAEEVQPPITDTGKHTENDSNDRLDFDSSMLEQAREVIGSDVDLSDHQLSQLHQIGFNDKQIDLLIEIMQDDTSITTVDQSYLSLPARFYFTVFFIILLFTVYLIYTKKIKQLFSKLHKFISSY